MKLKSFMVRKWSACILLLSISLLYGCALQRPAVFIPKKPPPPVMPKRRPQVALVLGAGGARGYAHLGVLSVLRRAGVPINLVAGASVGSVIGALYADNANWQQAYLSMMSAHFWDFADISAIPHLSGIMTGYHLEYFLLTHLRSTAFRDLKVPLVIVTTNLKTGKKYVIRSGPVAPAATASSSIPGLVQPPELYGYTLVDGGVVDPIPVDVVEQYHPKLIIAVDIDRQISPLMPITNVGILSRSIGIMGRKLSILSAQKADVFIFPQLSQSSTFDVSRAQWLYQQGRLAARKALPRILYLMKQKHIARQFDRARHTRRVREKVNARL